MKNKTATKILSVFLAVAIVLCSAPLSGLTGLKLPNLFSIKANAYTEGNFEYGTNSYWDSEKQEYHYYAGITGCVDPTGDIVIPSTIGGYPVEEIDYYAFEDCTGLTSVTIPDSVKSIGSYAFRNCSSLTSITIPDSVTSIGDSAFYNCTSLTSVTIPNSVTNIDDRAFESCVGLTSVTIGDGVKSIGSFAFNNCTSLTSVIIPNSVTNIDDCAFESCVGLTSVTIGDGVKSIGYSAFNYCTSLENIYYTSDIESWCDITYGNYLANPMLYAKNFYVGNVLQKDIVIPGTVTEIKDYAFCGCEGLTSVTIPDSVTSIGVDAFALCSSLTSVKIGNSVTSIGGEAFAGCEGLTSIAIPDSVTSIGAAAFALCSSLASVKIGNSVTSIGNEAFSNCTNLARVYYTGDVALWCKISFGGYYANPMCYAKNFYIGSVLQKDIVIPDTVTEIKDYAFYGCEGLNSVTIPDSVAIIGGAAFEDCTGLTSITISDSVTSIGNSAFSDCTGLTSITIPDSVTSIGNSAFSDCTTLTSVTIPNSITSIGSYTFLNCTGLTSVTIGNSVTSIGDSAFRDCSSLTSITIPDSVTSIGEDAFYNCTGLTSVTIPDSVTSIGNCAFYWCYGLEEVYYTGDIISWCNISFEYSYANPMHCAEKFYLNGELVENLVIPSGTTAIKSIVFYGFDCVKTVTIPASIITIYGNAFYECENIENVYYEGTDAQWDEIAIYDGNESLKNSNKTFLNGGHAHVYNSTVITESTCTLAGVKTFKCSCGQTYTESIPALGHTWGKWIVTLEPTATKDGRKVRVCTVCVEAVEEQTIPKSSSDNEDEEEPIGNYYVSVGDFSMDYKATTKLNPEIRSLLKYTVEYSSSNTSVATVDKDGNVTAVGDGTAEITVKITNSIGATTEDTCTVTVAKVWWQWLIIILLFGWIWY